MHDPLFRCATFARTQFHTQNLSMAITHSGRVESRPHAMTLDEFAQREADRLGAHVEQFRRYHRVLPCFCGAPDCEGWRALYKVTGRGRGEA